MERRTGVRHPGWGLLEATYPASQSKAEKGLTNICWEHRDPRLLYPFLCLYERFSSVF